MNRDVPADIVERLPNALIDRRSIKIIGNNEAAVVGALAASWSKSGAFAPCPDRQPHFSTRSRQQFHATLSWNTGFDRLPRAMFRTFNTT